MGGVERLMREHATHDGPCDHTPAEVRLYQAVLKGLDDIAAMLPKIDAYWQRAGQELANDVEAWLSEADR